MSVFSQLPYQGAQKIKYNEIDFDLISFEEPIFKPTKGNVPANYTINIKYKKGPFRVEYPKVLVPRGIQIPKNKEEDGEKAKVSDVLQYTMCVYFQGDDGTIVPEFKSEKLTEDDVARQFGEIDPEHGSALQEIRSKITEHIKNIKDKLDKCNYKPTKSTSVSDVDADIVSKCKNIAVPILRKGVDGYIDEPPYVKYYKVKCYTFKDESTGEKTDVKAKFKLATKGSRDFSYDELKNCKLYIRPVVEFRSIFVSQKTISLQSQICSGLIYDMEKNSFSDDQEDTVEQDMQNPQLQEKMKMLSLYSSSQSSQSSSFDDEQEIVAGRSSPVAGDVSNMFKNKKMMDDDE